MNGLKRYLIIGSVLILGYLVAQYFKPKPTDWSPTYLMEDKIPFGTYILHHHINDILPRTKIKAVQSDIYNTLKTKPPGRSNYFILAWGLKVDELDYQQMMSYMQAGNTIFIASYQFEGILLKKLKLSISSDFNIRNTDKKNQINFVNPLLKRGQNYVFDKGIGEQFFSKVDSSRVVILGKTQNEQANFVVYKFGKGSLYILPNPQLLTNYSLLKDDGLDYVSKALSYLPKADYLIWDEHFTRPDAQSQSELRVLFKYSQLKWAYYIALLSLLGFVFFEIKRRQRVIPVINRLKNTSVEFAEVVGRVYYQQRDNRDIAEKKIIYLLTYIRTKYRLKTVELNQDLSKFQVHRLISLKSFCKK
jgi:hypothetical protein